MIYNPDSIFLMIEHRDSHINPLNLSSIIRKNPGSKRDRDEEWGERE